MGTGIDGLSFVEMQRHVDTAIKQGRWVVFAGHDMGKAAQSTSLDDLAKLIAYMKDPANGIWLDTVGVIGAYVKKSRG
jgi:hypothetical protein